MTDERVTLLECSGGFKKQTNSNKIYRFTVKTAIIGRKIIPTESVKFPNFFIHFIWFEYWFGDHGFTSNMTSQSKEILYSEKVPIDFKINSPDIQFQILFSPSFIDNKPKSCTISQLTWLDIHFDNDVGLGEIFPIVDILQSFLEFCTQTFIYPDRFQGIKFSWCRRDTYKIINSAFLSDQDDEIEEPSMMDSLFPSHEDLGLAIHNIKKQRQILTPLLLYNEIRDDFETIMEKWFQLYERSHTEIDLYIATRRDFNSLPRATFLNLIFAIEGFHRQKKTKGKIIQKSMYKNAILPNLVEKCEKEVDNILSSENESTRQSMKDAVKGKLSMANQFSLAGRLREILCIVSNYGIDEVQSKREDFIKKVKDIRNDMSHGLSTNKIPSDEILMKINKNLKTIFEALILGELGIVKKNINGIWGQRNRQGINNEKNTRSN